MTWFWPESERIASDHPSNSALIELLDRNLHHPPNEEPRSTNDRLDAGLVADQTGAPPSAVRRAFGWYEEKKLLERFNAFRCKCGFRTTTSEADQESDPTCDACGEPLDEATLAPFWRLTRPPA